MSEELLHSVSVALGDCINLKRHENMLILCDPFCLRIGEAFYAVGREKCKEAILVMITSRKLDGNEPPYPIGEWLAQFDVVVMPSLKSLIHTDACRLATESGTRVVSMSGVTEEMFVRTMKADWRKTGACTRSVVAKLSSAQTIRVTTKAGTDLSFGIEGRKIFVDDGRISFKGAFGNLPAGEAVLAPVEGTAQGKLVIDSSFSLCNGKPESPIVMDVKDGLVNRVAKHQCSDELEKLFVKYLQPLRTLAEFGIGTLDTAQLSGNVFEEMKARGTVHFALGNNMLLGGTVRVPVHLDGVTLKPDIWLDDRLWIKDGEQV